MIKIEHPYYFLSLIFIPLAIWMYFIFLARKRKVLQQFGEWSLVEQLISSRSTLFHWIRMIILLLSFALIAAGLADIRSKGLKQTVNHQGLDVALVLDASNSMLTEDVEPNRITAAKEFTSELMRRLPDERLALITFAGKPVLQSPLTIDHGTIQVLVDNTSADNMPEQGSDIGSAIIEAVNALPENQQHYRVIILVSDGEDHEAKIEEAMRRLEDESIVLCTVGIGTPDGAPVQVIMNGEKTLKQDPNGGVIISKLQSEQLTKLATKNYGVFVIANNQVDKAVSTIDRYLDDIEKNQFDEEIFSEYESRFQWFLLAAIVFLIAELFIVASRPLLFRNPKRVKA